MPKFIIKRIIEENADIFTELIYPQFDNKSKFPSFLRLADKILVFKKDSKTSKHNYRTISMFKHFSKLSAEVMF